MNKNASEYFHTHFSSHTGFITLLQTAPLKEGHILLIGSDDYSGDAEFEYLDIYEASGDLVHEMQLTKPYRDCLRELNGHLERLCQLQKNSKSPHNNFDWTVIIPYSDISHLLSK